MLSDDVREVLSGQRRYAFQVGDCLDSLRLIPDGCVSCCVTSPPYFALRDYQTGSWEGGDPACEHKGSNGQQLSKSLATTRGGGHSAAETGPTPFRNKCQRCGAVRVDRQIGLEETPGAYVAKMVEVFAEVRRVLTPTGSLWCNMGDSFAGNGKAGRADAGREIPRPDGTAGKPTQKCNRKDVRRGGVGLKDKDLLGIPHQLVFALRDDGWYWRQTNHWCKNSPMPESVRDRSTSAVEYVFHLTKAATYFYDQEAGRVVSGANPIGVVHMDGRQLKQESIGRRTEASTLGTNYADLAGRNLWNWWNDISSSPLADSHYATMPQDLARRCIRLGSSEYGVCPKCSAPWQRILDRKQVKRPRPNDHVKRTGENGTGNSCANTVAGVTVQSKGWEPTCKCGTGIVPALILDPFSGAGTTALVANQLGRRAIGLELNPEYVTLSKRRLCNASLVKDDSLPCDPLPLFGE